MPVKTFSKRRSLLQALTPRTATGLIDPFRHQQVGKDHRLWETLARMAAEGNRTACCPGMPLESPCIAVAPHTTQTR